MQKDQSKISVITVCLNAAPLLKKTIESVLDQTYFNIEYIIVDGASKDNTQEIIKNYVSGVHHFISEVDNGLYDAMNKGIKEATGELIIFLNAGDYFVSKDVLLCSISKMKLENADIFFGRIIWNSPATKEITVSDHNYISKTWHLKTDNFPHPATFYKRKLFDTIGLFDESYCIYGDYEWNVKVLLLKRISFQYIPVITTVFTADGISNNERFLAKRNEEKERILRKYFMPVDLYKKDYTAHFFYKLKIIQKVISKIYNCQLKRIY